MHMASDFQLDGRLLAALQETARTKNVVETSWLSGYFVSVTPPGITTATIANWAGTTTCDNSIPYT